MIAIIAAWLRLAIALFLRMLGNPLLTMLFFAIVVTPTWNVLALLVLYGFCSAFLNDTVRCNRSLRGHSDFVAWWREQKYGSKIQEIDARVLPNILKSQIDAFHVGRAFGKRPSYEPIRIFAVDTQAAISPRAFPSIISSNYVIIEPHHLESLTGRFLLYHEASHCTYTGAALHLRQFHVPITLAMGTVVAVASCQSVWIGVVLAVCGVGAAIGAYHHAPIESEIYADIMALQAFPVEERAAARTVAIDLRTVNTAYLTPLRNLQTQREKFMREQQMRLVGLQRAALEGRSLNAVGVPAKPLYFGNIAYFMGLAVGVVGYVYSEPRLLSCIWIVCAVAVGTIFKIRVGLFKREQELQLAVEQALAAMFPARDPKMGTEDGNSRESEAGDNQEESRTSNKD